MSTLASERVVDAQAQTVGSAVELPNQQASSDLRRSSLRLYLARQASSVPRYALEQLVTTLCGGVPSVVGIALRAVAYRLILRMDGLAAIESGVRLRYASNIHLGKRVYLDQSVYIHATPGGVRIGDDTLVMYGSVLHVYNFRDLPHAGIGIGRNSLIGEYNVIRGQGGVAIGNRVYTSPHCQLIAVNHVFDDGTFEHYLDDYISAYQNVSRSAVALSKKLLYQIDGLDFEAALEIGAKANAEARTTDDCKKGIADFLGK